MYIYLKSHIYRERDLESSFCREGGGPRQSARTIRTPSRRRKATTMVKRMRPVRRCDVTARTSKARKRMRTMISCGCGNKRTPARCGKVKGT